MHSGRLLPSLSTRLCAVFAASVIAAPAASAEEGGSASDGPALSMMLPDMAATRRRFDQSIYAAIWNLPHLAEARDEFNADMDRMEAREGFSPRMILRHLGWGHMHIHAVLGEPGDQAPEMSMAADLGAAMEPVWQVMGAEYAAPASMPVGADAAYQMDGDHAPVAARFGSVLSMANGSAVFPQTALGDAEWDAELVVDSQALGRILEAVGNEIEPDFRDLLLGQADAYQVMTASTQLLPDGMREVMTWTGAAEEQVLQAVDMAIVDTLPADTLMALAVGIQGEALAQALTVGLPELMPQVAMPLAMSPIPVDTLARGLDGTMTIAVLPPPAGVPFPGVAVQVPVGSELATALETLLAGSGAPVQLPPPGSSTTLPPMPGVPLMVNLARNQTHVLITTQPGYTEQWLAGTGGGFAASPAAAAAMEAAGSGAPLIMGASDTPRIATTGKTLLMTFGAFMPPEPLAAFQAVLTTIEQRGGPGYMVMEGNSEGGRYESKGLIGGLTTLPIIAAIAIPNLMESRVAANESAAASMLKSGLFPAQVQGQAGAYRDGDNNGIGEYLYLPELSGATGVGSFSPPIVLNLISSQFNQFTSTVNGYQFRIYLPNGANLATDGTTPLDPAGASLRERYWIAYAVPEAWGDTGRRMFAIDQSGRVYTKLDSTMTIDTLPWNDLLGGQPWRSQVGADWVPYMR